MLNVKNVKKKILYVCESDSETGWTEEFAPSREFGDAGTLFYKK